ncbi:LamG domain-containing protein [Flavobacteriales bacterium]|nr:LamG domain-containing protein [Flavobacteriales bacterium]
MKQLILLIATTAFLAATALAQAPFNLHDNTGAGNCLEFDGTNDFVEVADDNSLDLTDELTISAWIRLDDTSGVKGIVTKYDSGPGAESYSLSINNAGDELQLFVTSTGAGWPYTYIVSNSVNFQTNQWYHVAGTYNNTGTDNIHLYVNGAEVAGTITNNDGGANSIEVTSVPILIGGYWEPPITPHRPFDGQIDEVRVWNIARSETQIRDNMCRQLTGSETGLVGYWPMNEGADNTCSGGQDVCDQSGNGNHGTKF